MNTDFTKEDPASTVWRFEDAGIMAGPYSLSELKEYVELGYIKTTTEVHHEDGSRYKAWEIGLFGDVVIVEEKQSRDDKILVENLDGWKFLSAILILCVFYNNIVFLLPSNSFFRGLKTISEYLFGLTFIALGVYAGVQGTILKGIKWNQTLIYILGGIVVSCIGIHLVMGKLGLL